MPPPFVSGYDNAVMESVFSTVKSEVEVFYHQRRRHSTLGQISPAAFRTTGDSRSVVKPSTKSDQAQLELRPF